MPARGRGRGRAPPRLSKRERLGFDSRFPPKFMRDNLSTAEIKKLVFLGKAWCPKKSSATMEDSDDDGSDGKLWWKIELTSGGLGAGDLLGVYSKKVGTQHPHYESTNTSGHIYSKPIDGLNNRLLRVISNERHSIGFPEKKEEEEDEDAEEEEEDTEDDTWEESDDAGVTPTVAVRNVGRIPPISTSDLEKLRMTTLRKILYELIGKQSTFATLQKRFPYTKKQQLIASIVDANKKKPNTQLIADIVSSSQQTSEQTSQDSDDEELSSSDEDAEEDAEEDEDDEDENPPSISPHPPRRSPPPKVPLKLETLSRTKLQDIYFDLTGKTIKNSAYTAKLQKQLLITAIRQKRVQKRRS